MRGGRSAVCATLVLVGFAVLFARPAGAVEPGKASDGYLAKVSQSVAINYYVHHPGAAPTQLARGLARMSPPPTRTTARSSQYCGSNANKDVFNCDFVGLPQNEESIASCPTNDNLVLGSTNDYNGLVFSGNITGWYWSTDGGHSV